MFACAIYPDNEPWFREEVRREADYQTRRLRNHPSMALWCGSNEDNWGFVDWWNGGANPKAPFWGGALSYNHILPQTVRNNCPETPYWNGSPYGGEHPNSYDAGDCHFWTEGTMSKEMARRIAPEAYDTVDARFVTEYGYIGPCVKSTIVRYHGGKPVDIAGPIYQLHNNTFEKETVPAGIRKHYRDPSGMSLDQYLLYASLVQGLMYGYSLESIRANPRNNGSLFWMYADCWGEVGWTIIDYYLRRKPSWYFVRRAFMTRKLVMRERGGAIEVTGINDTATNCALTVQYGWVGFDGKGAATQEARIVLPARSRGVVLKFEKGRGDPRKGIHFARPMDGGEDLLPATLRQLDYRERELTDPGLEVDRPGRRVFHRPRKGICARCAFRAGGRRARLGRVLRSPAGGVPEDHAVRRVTGLGADHAAQRAMNATEYRGRAELTTARHPGHHRFTGEKLHALLRAIEAAAAGR